MSESEDVVQCRLQIDEVYQQNVSSESNSPTLFECSFDSGICVEGSSAVIHKKLQEYKRILLIVERDKEMYRLLRERLSKIVDRKKQKKPSEEEMCNVCCAEINTEDAKSCVVCCICKKSICRRPNCSEWKPKEAQWECQLCHTNRESFALTSSWVAEQFSFNNQKCVYPMRARSEIYIPLSDPNERTSQFESVSQVGVMSSVGAEDRMRIRQYVEEVVANLLGGSLDNISVGQLSRSENYVHNTSNENGEFRGISHIRLRQLVESIIAETLRLPGLSLAANDEPDHTQQTPALTNGGSNHKKYFEPRLYQELLATAVLNKIVDTHGNERNFSESSPDLSTGYDKNHNALLFKQNPIPSSGSSSIEPRSDSSLTDTDQLLNQEVIKDDNSSPSASYSIEVNDNFEPGRESILSDYIASHMVPLPDISEATVASGIQEEESDEGEDYTSVASSGWEDNWLFKKKRNEGKVTSASSVGMLVPAPKEDVRAQIGDRTTDEISDLSEVGSDTEESSSLDLIKAAANMDPLNDRLLNKHLIGGKNTGVALDELVDQTSMISSSSLTENEPMYRETKNKHVRGGGILNELQINPTSKPSNPVSIIPTEAINANLTKSILQNSPPNSDIMTEDDDELILAPPTNFTDDERLHHLMETIANQEDDSHSNYLGGGNSGDEELFPYSQRSSVSGPLSGSIAEREYKKWYNAVEMPNNPYSPEALKRRLSESSEKFIDLPNISPSTELATSCIKDDSNQEDNESVDPGQVLDYKRYSRDYYINDSKHASGTTKRSCTSSPSPTRTDVTSRPISSKEIENAVSLHGLSTTVPSLYNEQPTQSEIKPEIYQAKPAVVVDETAAAEVILSSITSDTLTPSDDSDTIRVYNLKKQETKILRQSNVLSSPASPIQSPTTSPTRIRKKLRPTDLQFGTETPATVTTTGAPLFQPTKSLTPTSLKFLQPKRKLIDPGQILSSDVDITPITPLPVEKNVIEEDVVHALPSVKALAQAFLMTSNKRPEMVSRWHKPRSKIPKTPTTPAKEAMPHNASIPFVVGDNTSQGSADDATIASDLSSLETDPPSKREPATSPTPSTAGSPRPLSPVLIPSGYLKNNIAFFENLKNK